MRLSVGAGLGPARVSQGIKPPSAGWLRLGFMLGLGALTWWVMYLVAVGAWWTLERFWLPLLAVALAGSYALAFIESKRHPKSKPEPVEWQATLAWAQEYLAKIETETQSLGSDPERSNP